jgi:hypothetical protein
MRRIGAELVWGIRFLFLMLIVPFRFLVFLGHVIWGTPRNLYVKSIAPIPGTPRARGIGGGNRADKMVTKGGLYDQIKITAPNSGVNGKVDVLDLSNLYTKGGPCILSRIKAGILDITYLEVGNGDGFAAKDFEITGTTTYKTFSNVDNVEVSISPPS